MRLITNTCCECTRCAHHKSEVKDLFHKVVSRKKGVCRPKSPKFARKNTSWDPFFNDDDAVKSIKKASNRLRPGGTSCMMPKYVDAIEGRLEFCSTSSVIGLCNRKGNDATSCRALWKKHVSPEKQETFLTKLHTLTAADLEEFQHKFGGAMMLRIYEVYENDKHTDTLGYNQGLNELRESVEKLKIDRANEIGEGTPQKKMRVRDRHSTVKREKCLRIE